MLFPASPLPLLPLDTETDTKDYHNKDLEPFSRTGVFYDPRYPQPPLVNWDARLEFVTNGVLWVPGTQSCESPREASVWKTQALIGVARVHKWQIMTYKWEFMWPLEVPGDPGRDGEGVH